VTDTALWSAVIGELEVSISKAHFETWLRNTKLKSINEQVAVVTVPNIFIREWVESRYKGQFLESFKKHVHTLEDVEFLIDGAVPDTVPVVETVEDTPAIQEDVPETPTPFTQSAPRSAGIPNNVRTNQTFDTFVEGNNSRLASAVGRAVSKSPGTLYNPLFIYGGVGLGKTHLLHAIANQVLLDDPKKHVLYVSSEKFTNDYIASISSRKTNEFKNTYRTLDLLLVDDIQFIANKEGSQEEFFNTFNTLHQSNRQIVIAADRVPKAIPGLEERLSSRFGWGMVVDIQPPNFETRLAILQSKCEEKRVEMPTDALEYIARQVQSNIRELEGALNRAVTYCQMTHVPFSLTSTQAALSGLIVPTTRRTYSVDTIFTLIAEHFGITTADIIGKKRNQELVYPRHVAMYILKEDMDMSYPQIGRELGGRDHTTIMHGYNKINAEIAEDTKIQHDVSKIKDRLANL
jgi:chromosomal replication initiator protein